MLVNRNLKKILDVVSSDVEDTTTNDEMKYLVLHVTEDENGSSFNTWELVTGRQAVVDAVYTILKENGYYNFFKSNVMSDRITMDKCISVYTFIRKFMESGEVDMSAWGIETLDDFHDYIFDEDKFIDDMAIQGIDDVTGLTRYFNADIQHKSIFEE